MNIRTINLRSCLEQKNAEFAARKVRAFRIPVTGQCVQVLYKGAELPNAIRLSTSGFRSTTEIKDVYGVTMNGLDEGGVKILPNMAHDEYYKLGASEGGPIFFEQNATLFVSFVNVDEEVSNEIIRNITLVVSRWGGALTNSAR